MAAALTRVARQQGQRRLLLAWLGEAQAAGEASEPLWQQQQQQRAAGLLAVPACTSNWLWQQQGAGLHTLSSAQSCAAVGPGAALRQQGAAAGRAAVAAAMQQQRGWEQQQLQQPPQQQQWRGYAMRSGYRPRRKDVMPDRNLPQRNEEIRAAEVRVLSPDPDGPSNVMPLKAALKQAKKEGLDLVMVSPKAEPPVVRMMEWSKVLYEQQKREKAALKQRLAQQKAADAKEVRIGCAIAEHDLAVKMAQARRFLEDGSSLRLVVTFKGGSQIALGREVTLYLIGQLADICKLKDEKHLQRPMKGHWAVMLVPLPPAAAHPAPGKAAPGSKAATSSGATSTASATSAASKSSISALEAEEEAGEAAGGASGAPANGTQAAAA